MTLCPRCESGVESAASPRCARCGGPLVVALPEEPDLLDKLVQLAQFGLTAGVGPLLEPRRDAE